MTNKLVLALLLTLITSPIQAMRCGNRLVQEGDTKLEVLRKCGEPTFSEGSGIIEQEDEMPAHHAEVRDAKEEGVDFLFGMMPVPMIRTSTR